MYSIYSIQRVGLMQCITIEHFPGLFNTFLFLFWIQSKVKGSLLAMTPVQIPLTEEGSGTQSKGLEKVCKIISSLECFYYTTLLIARKHYVFQQYSPIILAMSSIYCGYANKASLKDSDLHLWCLHTLNSPCSLPVLEGHLACVCRQKQES